MFSDLLNILLDVIHTLFIWDPEEHLGSPKLSKYILSENIEGGLEWSLASAYVLCLYKSHRLYILDWKLLGGGKMCYC